MIIIDFRAELHGNREVTLNGYPLTRGEGMIEEKVIEKTLTLDQQWELITMLRKLSAKAEHAYRCARIRAGEDTSDEFRRKRVIAVPLGGPSDGEDSFNATPGKVHGKYFTEKDTIDISKKKKEPKKKT